MSVIHKRKEKQFLIAVSHIIANELTNANISYPTVTSVKLSRDSSHLTVYVTFMNNPDRSLEALNNSKGVVKKLIAASVQQRRVPDVVFAIDTATDDGNRIDQILKEIRDKK